MVNPLDVNSRLVPVLSEAIFRVSDPAVGEFYRERFGMILGDDGYRRHWARFGEGAPLDAALEFWCDPALARGPRYAHDTKDGYWKVGVTLPDVAAARRRLRAAGVEVSQPQQFEDIGFLCHLQDSAGFIVELLQHRFEDNFQPMTPTADPLGGRGTLGQITLRVKNPAKSLAFYRDGLGMTLLARQPVPNYGFTLYFLAFTDERPPVPDLAAVANREWLWQRPYTTLELQHRWGTETDSSQYHVHPDGVVGFWGVGFTYPDLSELMQRMEASAASVNFEAAYGTQVMWMKDPDGYRLRILDSVHP